MLCRVHQTFIECNMQKEEETKKIHRQSGFTVMKDILITLLWLLRLCNLAESYLFNRIYSFNVELTNLDIQRCMTMHNLIGLYNFTFTN